MYLVGDFIPQQLRPVCMDIDEDELVLANLEGPVCGEACAKANKVGIHLRSSPFALPGRWAFALANNHVMDFGSSGLQQTCVFLDHNKFPHSGAGPSREASREPMLLEESGKRIAVFSCCERQFGVSEDALPGVAEKGLWLMEAIKVVKESRRADYVIVSCHAASEFSPFVNPSLREFYHLLIDHGADVIHGHHSHVPQGVERYGRGFIAYGLGNFVVNVDEWRQKNCDWSNVVHLKFSDHGVEVDWVRPYCITKEDGCARSCAVAEGERLQALKAYNEYVNLQCSDDDVCMAVWQEVCVRLYHRVYEQLLRAPSVEPMRLSFRSRARKLYFLLSDFAKIIIGKEMPTFKSRKYGMGLYNYFNCESHVDMIRTALGVLTGSIKDLRSMDTAKCSRECGV